MPGRTGACGNRYALVPSEGNSTPVTESRTGTYAA